MLSITKSSLAGKTLKQTLFFFLLATQMCFAQGEWEKIGDMPEVRLGHTTDEINGKIYVAGGVKNEQMPPTYPTDTTMFICDSINGSWTRVSLPNSIYRSLHTSCVVDGNLYLIGGVIPIGGIMNSTAEMWMYNTTTGEWIPKPSMPTHRLNIDCAVVDGKIYVMGGMQINNGIPNNTELLTLEVYDITAGTWSPGPNMNSGRWGHQAIAYNGKIYVFGGNLPVYYSSVEVFDPQANSWTILSTFMPTGRYQFAACLLDTLIYTIDGWFNSANGPIYDKVEVYNPVAGVWKTETSIPIAVGLPDCLTMNGKIYFFGGSNTTHPLHGTSDIWEFTPPIIPVELTSFTAVSNGTEIILNWSTATETNNQGFSIERKSCNSEFTEIGFVPGFGTTTEPKSYSYTDSKVLEGRYTYRLKQIDFDGSFEYLPEVEVEVAVPLEFSLEQNYPNPFNPTTTIGFGLQNISNVKIIILNTIGEEVAVVLDEEREAGYHTVEINAGNLPSGVYFYQLNADNYIETKKMILLK